MKKLLHYSLSFFSCFILIFSVYSQTQTLNLGSGTSESASSYHGPNHNWYDGYRIQFVYPANELKQNGVECGVISRIGFYVVDAASASFSNYTIKMKNVAGVHGSANFIGGATTVWNGNWNDVANSWNYFDLNNDFFWEGRALLVEICIPQGALSSTSSAYGTYRYYNPSGTYDMPYEYDVANICSDDAFSYGSYRPLAKIVVTPGPETPLIPGTISPASQTICEGSTQTFSLAGSNADTYQWEYSTDGSNWNNAPGSSTGTNYTSQAGAAPGTYYIRVLTQYNYSCGEEYSNTVTLNIDPTTVPGSISPASQQICEQSTANLTLGGHTGDILRWQVSNSGTGGWSNITHTDPNYTTPVLSTDKYYRAKVKSGVCPTGNSTVGEVLVSTFSVAGTASPLEQTICRYQNAALSLVGYNGTIQWQKSANGSAGWTNEGGATAATYNPSPAGDMYYRAVITNGPCTPEISNTVKVNVTQLADPGNITASPSSLCSGESANLSISDQDPLATLQWQDSVSGGSWQNVSGQTGETMNTGALTQTTWYRIKVRKDDCDNYGTPIQILVSPPSDGGAVNPVTQSSCMGLTGPINLINYVGNTFQWQDSLSGGDWTDIPGATNDNYPPNPSEDSWYRAKVKSGGCEEAISAIGFAEVVDCIRNGGTQKCKGTIADAGGPSQNYGADQDYTYTIQPSGATSITLSFSAFDIQAKQSVLGEDVYTDYLDVFDGPDDQSPLLGRYEGNSIPADITSTGGSMTLQFVSDAVTNRAGFVATWVSNVPLPTINPLTQTISKGDNATIDVSNINGEIQWQESFDQVEWTNVTGETSTQIVQATQSTRWYRARVRQLGGCVDYTTPSEVIVKSGEAEFSTLYTEICPGESVDFSHESTGIDSVWWFFDGGDVAATKVDDPSITYNTPGLYDVKLVAYSEDLGTDTMLKEDLIFVKPLADAGNVSSSYTVCERQPASVSTSGSFGDLNWQDSTASGSWVNIPLATGETHNEAMIMETTWFRVIATGECNTDKSDIIQITAIPEPVSGNARAGKTQIDTTICKGEPLTVSLINSDGTIQWQDSSSASGWTDIVGETSDELSIASVTETKWYRAVVSRTTCSDKISGKSKVTVEELPDAGTVSNDQVICDGEDANISISGINGTIQWQDSISGGTWANRTGASSFNTGALSETTWYRAIVSTTNCGAAVSDIVQITVGGEPLSGTLTSNITSVCSGETVTLEITGNSGNVQYQDSTDGGAWQNIGGATSSEYTTNTLTDTTWFRVLNTSNCGASFSNIQKITVIELPNAGNIGANQSICEGKTVTLNPDEHNGDLQWQESTDGIEWVDVSGETSDNYSTGSLSADIWIRLEAQVAGCGVAVSNEVKIAVGENPDAGTMEGSNAICVGEEAWVRSTLYVGSIQYQDSTEGGSWSDITGATSGVYTTNELTETTWIRAIVTNGCGTVVSGVHQIVVRDLPNAGVISSSQTICDGKTFTLGTSESYGDLQWQDSTASGTWENITGAIGSSFSSALNKDTWYRIIASTANCGTNISNVVSVTVEPNPVAGSLTGTPSTCVNQPINLQLSGYSGNIQYQDSVEGDTWTNITGAEDALYNASLSETTWYRVEVSSENCGLVYSNVWEVVIRGAALAGNLGADQTICEGDIASFTAEGADGDLQWQKSLDEMNWNDIGGETGTSYNSDELNNDIWYRTIASTGGCENDTSDAVQVFVYPTPKGGNISGVGSICAGQSADLSLVGYNGAIQYQDSIDGGVWKDIIGANSSDFNTNVLTDTTWFKASVSTGCAITFSDEFMVAVSPNPDAGNIGQNQTICSGESITLSTNEYTGGLQWQKSNNGSSWDDILDANSDSYTSGSLTSNTWYRLVAAVFGCGVDVSNEILITPEELPVAGTLSGVTQLCEGNEINLSLDGYKGSIQYQKSVPGGVWQNISGATDDNYATILNTSTWFRVQVSQPNCGTVTSNVLKINVDKNPQAGNIGTDADLCDGENLIISTNAYQAGNLLWQMSGDGLDWENIPGAVSDLYDTGVLTENTWYRLVAYTDNCGTDTSNSKLISVHENPVAGTITGDESVCLDESATFTISGSQGDYIWQYSTDEGVTYNNLTEPNIPTTFITSSIERNYWVRAIVYNENCGSVYTNVLPLEIYDCDLPESMLNATEDTVCKGQLIHFKSVSTKADSIAWTFNGGSPFTSSAQEEFVRFDVPGDYEIWLESFNRNGSDMEKITIHVAECKLPTAEIESSGSVVCLADSLLFKSTSRDGNSVRWLFEGGTPSESTADSVYVAYHTAGLYDVRLIVANKHGEDTLMQNDIVNAMKCYLPNMDFTFVVDSGTVTFTNTSADAATWKWNFGDSEDSTDVLHPTHVYDTPGSYLVCLWGENSVGTDVGCKYVEIEVVNGILANGSGLESQVYVYPVPASEHLYLRFENQNTQVSKIHLINTLGEIVPVDFINKNEEVVISLSDLSTGVYWLNLETRAGSRFARQIIVKE